MGTPLSMTLLRITSIGLNISTEASLAPTCLSASLLTSFNAASTKSTFDCACWYFVFFWPEREARKSTRLLGSRDSSAEESLELDRSLRPFNSSLPTSGTGKPPGMALALSPLGSSNSSELARKAKHSGTILLLSCSY